ncbi:MAG: DUF1343 domain-containing protein [Acidobacteriota bacterium]|jgi:uncharacterized protein YbbC (DUF1343 family)
MTGGVRTGLDRLLARLAEGGSGAPRPGRYALLAHGASVTAGLEPAHLALAASAAGPPALLVGPEHGYYGVEQDMVPSGGGRDPWTGVPIVSLYGDSEGSLRPDPAIFDGIDTLVIDLQDVGSRYYTYAATALWAAEAALGAGTEVWILDRPNPLGGDAVEGNLPEPGHESFVGAFRLPVRHGLTLAELGRLEARRGGWGEGLRVWRMTGWERWMEWEATGRPWIAPSPNMPTPETARLYPGGCLVEATRISEGRGTTRPFHLIGAPGVDPPALVRALEVRALERTPPEPDEPGFVGPWAGLKAVPTYFRPQFQKHAGAVCGGVELVITDPARLRPYRAGVHLIAALAEAAPEAFGWRSEPYEFVRDRPAIDLLTGAGALRRALESGDATRQIGVWVDSWAGDEEAFRAERREALLYPEPGAESGVKSDRRPDDPRPEEGVE